MEVTLKTRDAVFKLEAADMEDLVKQVAEIHVVFGHEPCGMCGCEDIILSHRTPQGYDYYEKQCTNPKCGARLQFGMMKDARRFFAKRLDKDCRPLEHNGWFIYQGERQYEKPILERANEGHPDRPANLTAKPAADAESSPVALSAASVPTDAKEYYAALSAESKAAVKSLPVQYRRTFCERAIALRVTDKEDLVAKAEVHRRLIAEYNFSKDEYLQVCSCAAGTEEEKWAPLIKRKLPEKEQFMASLAESYDPFILSQSEQEFDPFSND